MSRSQQDQFIDEDEEEETCPLCVEELDITDKNFKPCPCGYQICQFCYNNIKTTMNGLCPACRRPYDEKNIQWKAVTQEEMLQHKQNLAQQAKKKAAAKQKEAQKREADNLSRKHLAGLRVRQKNLVYVTGMKPKIHGDQLIELLRGPQYFGQYGNIIKIVVANPSKPTQQSVGIYVTFARNEDAATCIDTMNKFYSDGSIRAQFGTTKYCSAYLRGETCNNRNCMFLHEPGDENERYTRQDLSSLNASSSQSMQPQPPLQQTVPIAAATQDLGESAVSPTESPGPGPALPATASWANQARRASRATTGSAASPMTTNTVPLPQASESKSESRASPIADGPSTEIASKSQEPVSIQPAQKRADAKAKSQTPRVPHLDAVLKAAFDPDIFFSFSAAHLSDKDREILDHMPPLWDPNGANKRREARKQVEALQKEQEEAESTLQAASSTEAEETTEGGSAQLGGDAEERSDRPFGQGHHAAIQPPSQHGFAGTGFGLDQNLDLGGIGLSRALTPQDHRQQLLQQLKNVTNTQGSDHLRGGAPGHGRTGSRFNFAGDGAAGTTTTSKPLGGANILKQHPLMGQGGQFGNLGQHQPLISQYYSSGVQGPPPGLKTTGTPPVSGGGMFGQGHGFTPGVTYGANARDTDKLWEYQRGQRGGAQMPDASKRELMFPYQQHHPSTSSSPAPGLLNFPYGQQGAFSESGSSKQKKKGKKHRHANTSSSGGGGPVDVTDPSILQARLHQNGALPGQGLYGGQGQGGFSLYGNTYSRGW